MFVQVVLSDEEVNSLSIDNQEEIQEITDSTQEHLEVNHFNVCVVHPLTLLKPYAGIFIHTF